MSQLCQKTHIHNFLSIRNNICDIRKSYCDTLLQFVLLLQFEIGNLLLTMQYIEVWFYLVCKKETWSILANPQNEFMYCIHNCCALITP